ncbi:hypothetical protein ACLOJK_030147 [Asimina triloba]
MSESRSKSGSGTNIQITALDAIVNVNSLYTLAVFLGLAWNPYDPSNILISDTHCFPSKQTAENLISFHIYSFSSFLFSSLLALCLKQAITLFPLPLPPYDDTYNHDDDHHEINGYRFPRFPAPHLNVRRLNRTLLQLVLLVTAAGSASGCVFLMLALVNVVQVKLGTLACGSSYTYGAVVPLLIFVPAGLLIYIGLVLYAFTL